MEKESRCTFPYYSQQWNKKDRKKALVILKREKYDYPILTIEINRKIEKDLEIH